jgi:hypothetical protein
MSFRDSILFFWNVYTKGNREWNFGTSTIRVFSRDLFPPPCNHTTHIIHVFLFSQLRDIRVEPLLHSQTPGFFVAFAVVGRARRTTKCLTNHVTTVILHHVGARLHTSIKCEATHCLQFLKFCMFTIHCGEQ